jgi:acetylornithine deacetylase/succinyl-diaminopimelate desuccinylase-like protein
METTALLTELVAIDSTNSTLDPHGAGEGAMATRLAELLDGLGFAVSVQEIAPGRPNVLGVRHGDPSLPTLLFEAHLDTVPAPPGGIPVRREVDRLFGRGSCDCKGALAAMLCALEQVSSDAASLPTVLLAGVADEETAMTGSAALLGALPTIAGAVIAEPTSLVPVRAHHGVVRVAMTAHGRAAHAATAHLGVNAILAAARALDALDRDVVRPLAATDHALTGPATLTPSVIRGGIAPNIVPDACEVILDRRTAPGTTSAAAWAEIDAVLESLRRAGDDVRLGAPFVALPSVETPADDPIVTAAERAASRALGRPVIAGGVAFATDACHLLGTGGIPSVVLGPGSIEQAHTADEWVDLREVETAVAIYAGIVREFARPLPAGR